MSSAEVPGASEGRDARAALIALLVVQIGIGYEWCMSGLTKIYRGYLIEWGELVVGLGFIVAAAWWLCRGESASSARLLWLERPPRAPDRPGSGRACGAARCRVSGAEA